MESARARRALALLWLAFAVYVLHPAVGLGGKGLESFFNDWLYNGLLVLAALACFARGLLRRDSQRAAWLLVGVALSAWATGDIYYSVALEHLSSIPFPSIDDAFYLAFYPPAYVASGCSCAGAPPPSAQQLARRDRGPGGGRRCGRGGLPAGTHQRRRFRRRRVPPPSPIRSRTCCCSACSSPLRSPAGAWTAPGASWRGPHASRARRQHLPLPDRHRELRRRRHPGLGWLAARRDFALAAWQRPRPRPRARELAILASRPSRPSAIGLLVADHFRRSRRGGGARGGGGGGRRSRAWG